MKTQTRQILAAAGGLSLLLGLGWFLSRTRKAGSVGAAVGEIAADAEDLVAGAWSTVSKAVVVPAALRPRLERIAARVPDVEIIVTSATRGPAAQARAMASKIQRGEDLFALYAQDDLVAEIVAAAGNTADPDVDAMAAVIEAQVARGRFISRHLRADALDLRTRHLTDEQVERLVAAVRAEGAEAVPESDHLHVEELA